MSEAFDRALDKISELREQFRTTGPGVRKLSVSLDRDEVESIYQMMERGA